MNQKKPLITVLNSIIVGLLSLTSFILLVAFSMNLSGTTYSVWGGIGNLGSGQGQAFLASTLTVLYLANLAFLALTIIYIFSGKGKNVTSTTIYYNLGFLIFYLFASSGLYNYNILGLVIFLAFLNIAALVLYYIANLTKSEPVKSPSKIVILIIQSVAIAFLFFCGFLPLMTRSEGFAYSVALILSSPKIYNFDMLIIGCFFTVFFLVNFCYYLAFLFDWVGNSPKFLKRSVILSRLNLGLSGAFFAIGFIYCFAFVLQGVGVATACYLPFLITAIFNVVIAYFHGKIKVSSVKQEKKQRMSFVPLLFLVGFTVLLFGSLFGTYINIRLEIFDLYEEKYKLTGLNILQDFRDLKMLFQVFAFLYFIFLATSAMLLVISLSAYFGKSKDYYKIVKYSVFTNFSFFFLISMSVIFFFFNQALVDYYVKVILNYLGIVVNPLYSYKISSDQLYFFAGALILLIVMFLTRQLNHDFKEEKEAMKNKFLGASNTSPSEQIIDPCPAFSELDDQIGTFEDLLYTRRRASFNNVTLPELVGFVVDYAQRSRLHLTYSYEDIATFVAGLGSAKLAILQGLSGTGKTSLPKIFAEAISGNCDLVEVESSWRDKNELIGYYNEFSRRFTPRKFTQALYKAKLNPEIPTFIVLDEMNLSRIEYYFSDFLSLMEAETANRQLKLLNIKINPPDKESYLGLDNGHTIFIPNNIWFVGTANHDESTFEISDKVYDRAQTMEFNKRVTKVRTSDVPLAPRFVSLPVLQRLFDNAQANIRYDAESDVLVQQVEHLLAPYNISFGNRALNQIEAFVKIYCACFSNGQSPNILKQAVETVLFSKVVRKLVTRQIDDKEELANQFEKLGLTKCSKFIAELIED